MNNTSLKALEDYEKSAKMRWKLSERKSDYTSYYDIKQLVKTVKEYDKLLEKQTVYIKAAGDTLNSYTKIFDYMRRYLGENIWEDMLRNVALYEFKESCFKKGGDEK